MIGLWFWIVCALFIVGITLIGRAWSKWENSPLVAWASEGFDTWMLYADGDLVSGSGTVFHAWPSGERADGIGGTPRYSNAYWRISKGQHRGIRVSVDEIKQKYQHEGEE